jgi:NAD(P)-dependent dehydrogenase (short-subunit alcohol dehydrogenase family)
MAAARTSGPRVSDRNVPFEMQVRLGDRSVIVTGAAKGIGRSIAERCCAEGARVALIDRDDSVMDVATSLGAIGAVVDLADTDATRETIAAVIARLEGCWCLVNNAGVFAKAPLLDLEPADFDSIMAINARSMLVTMQEVVPSMIAAGGGRIVNQASMAAKLGTPGELAYASSKAAVVAMSRIASMELGPHGITVNAVCPGYVLTELGAETRNETQVDNWTSQSPLGRLADAHDVSSLVVYLASDGGYVTGQALNVSGGMCTW